jgi:ribosome-associated translation inhibitor RaiA
MIRIHFKSMDPSPFVEAVVLERLEHLKGKFPGLQRAKIKINLAMENSPIHPGPDLFTARIQILHGRYSGILVCKSAPNLYAAIADLMDHMLERLNRHGDRKRVKERTMTRRNRFAHRFSA